ncbi:filamentous hemagglutinin N-terminal domain-containing protein, partial [Nostoc sp. CHAB 5784]|uniref:two-partner secretion domain-containing protein n=1 Tax=Nostoc mirabile TaxID=2907820 RepID=UPI001E329437
MLGITQDWRYWYCGLAMGSQLIAFSQEHVFAQIAPDGTLPNNSSITRDGNTFNITGGTQTGSNLFHSFGEFSVPIGGTASFNNALDIQNIISRVTGGSVSNINGIISTKGTANLFLINPNGIIFGQNAQLNVGGSFVATTASAIGFGDQSFFSAENPESSSSLLTVNPSALLFNQIKTASIQNNSVAPSGLNPSSEFIARGLRVPNGKSLLLVGGGINMDGGSLFAFDGRVDLGGLKGTGTIGLNFYGNNLSLSFPDNVERSDVLLSRGSLIYVAANDGGSIAVNAQNLEIIGGSGLLAGINRGLGSNNSKAGNIDLNATGVISVNNSSLINNSVFVEARGQAGNININAETLVVKDGAQVSTSTWSRGKGGNLNVDAQDIEIIGTSADGRFGSSLFASALPNSTGDTGDLTIKTNTLLLKDGAYVSTGTRGGGKGGNLNVDAQNVQIIGTSANGEFVSGLYANAIPNSTGDAGDLTIKTNTLLIKDGAQVSASTWGGGKGGNLNVDAQDVQIIASGLFAGTNSTGDAGDLTIKTNTLLLKDGAQVSASTWSRGKGGNLSVDAQDIEIIGTSADGRFGSGLLASAQANSAGDAGDLTIKTNTLLLKDGAQVSTGTSGEGDGGNLSVDAQDIEIIGTSADGRFGSSLLASAQANSTGDAGDLTIKTHTLLLKDGAQVSASTFGGGKGGNLSVNAQDVQIIGRSADGGFGSGLLANAELNSTGDAGDLTIKTHTLLLKDGAQVATGTWGGGKGGNLSVDAQDVQIIGRSADGGFGSGLFANAEPNSTGDAGDLTIKTHTLLLKDGAQVFTGTWGGGDGGNLSVDAQDVQFIGTSADGRFGSGLYASAQPNSTGDAGDLTIKTNTLLLKDGAQVSAGTLGGGEGGNLSVDAQDVQIIGTSADGGSASGLYASAEPNSKGDAGDLTIKINTLLLKDGAQVSASTWSGGKGGNLSVDAQNVQIIGTSADGRSASALRVDAEPNSTGDGGDLIIKTHTLLIKDGAQVSAATFGGGEGGNLSVDAQDVQIIGTSADGRSASALSASAEPNSKGDAGDLTIKTNTLLLKDGAQVSAATFGGGEGGNLSVDAQHVQIIGESADSSFASGLYASAAPNSTGNAGDLTIKTNTLLVQDGSQINVQSSGIGTAGIMTLNARSIRLNNNAVLRGNTQSARFDPSREQATININSESLIMSRNSNIRTNATGKDVIGGNINIDTDFLIAFGNSDISANSDNFRGGRVQINASGIFGTQFRDVASNSTSDITATGASPQLNGTVELNTPGIDPNSGLVELPIVPVDTQLAQGCYSPGYAQNRFVITGRGGLPPNPKDILTPDATQIDWVPFKPNNNNRSLPPVTNKPTTPTP